jgi:hypothetical protein
MLLYSKKADLSRGGALRGADFFFLLCSSEKSPGRVSIALPFLDIGVEMCYNVEDNADIEGRYD